MKEKQRKKKTRESGKLPQRLSSVGFAGAVLLVLAICGCRRGTTGEAEEAAAFVLPKMPELAAAMQAEAERVIEAEIEITYPFPGGLEDYRPAYCLQLDNNLGYCIPLMVELES